MTASTGEDRDRIAEDRDKRADAHDLASEARDGRSEARDERAEARELSNGRADPGAADDRAGAWRDRRGGASDRTQSADDRHAASVDRVASARERETASIDQLTGTYHRDAGIIEVEREIAKAKRTKQPLTLAFVDVDGLKRWNDFRGHPAGDRLLRDTADSIRTHFRPYDLIVRFGGDEFLCALLGMNVAQATERFSRVNADLASHQASITAGLTALEADESAEDLIARADEAMYRKRHDSRGAGS